MSDMSRKLLDRVVNEKVSAMEKSILINQGLRNKYIDDKRKMEIEKKLGEEYQRRRRTFGGMNDQEIQDLIDRYNKIKWYFS